MAVLNMKHRHKKGWLFLVLNRVWHCVKQLFFLVNDLHRGEWDEGVTWATFLLCQRTSCLFIQCLADNRWGARLGRSVRTEGQPQHHPLASHILSSSLPFGQKWNLYTTHLAGWRPRQVRHHRLLWTRPEKSNCPLVWPMEENVNQAKKIQSSRHQHCTSARRNSQLSEKKKALAVAMVDYQWPLAPDASAQHWKFLNFALGRVHVQPQTSDWST